MRIFSIYKQLLSDGNVCAFKNLKRGILCFILLLGNLLISQTPELKFEHFIDDKGLTQNTILDIEQDQDGFLWIGTANGLYKYDGQRFTIYRNNPKQTNTIINNVINKLTIDDDNVLWIGTVGGLCSYDINKEQFFNSNKALIDKEITAIYTDDIDKSVWVGTSNSGLYHISNPNTEHVTIEHFYYQPYQSNVINNNRILSIAKDRHGNLWVGTEKGLNRMYLFTSNSKNFISVKGFDKPVDAIFLDSKERLWVGELGTGVYSLEKPTSIHALSKDSFKRYSLNLDASYENYGNISAIKEDLKGEIWVGVFGYGLYQLNAETGDFKMYSPNDMYEESLSNRRIKTVLIDKTNVLWAGTEVGGLNKCDLQKKDIIFLTRNKLSKNTLSNPSINAILEDGEYLWLGTENGLNQIKFNANYQTPKIQHYFFDGSDKPNTLIRKESIKSIFKDKDGDFWIGKEETVINMKLNPVSKKVSFKNSGLALSNVFSIIEDRQGWLWFGSYGNGIIKWKKNKEFDFSNAIHYKSDLNNEYSIGGDSVSCLFEDSKGNIWIGSLQGGLSLLIRGENTSEDRFLTYLHDPNDPNSLSHNSVFSIHEDKDGNIWIGTFGGGLNKMTFSENGQPIFEHYTESDGLANNAVYGILEDDKGKLWMSTDNGISCFNPKDKTFKNFNKGDGLQSNNFRKGAYYKNKYGYLFFGGLRGLNIFHPENLKDNTYLAEPKLTSFKIKNEIVATGKAYNGRIILNESQTNTNKIVQLKYHENTLTFEFAALHYAAPEKNKFQYQLVGFDKQWQDSKGLPFAHYTNLSSGNYTFKVKASNNDGIWNEIPAEFKFKINPPFWYTWWAYVLYILLLTGIIFAIVSYIGLQEKEKAAVKVQKEIEYVNRLKLQFFTNISHEFKTPITLILNPIEELLETIGDSVKVKAKLQIIQRNANSLLRLVHQLMEFRKIEVGETKLGATKSNVINFVREITNSFKASARKSELEINFESSLKKSEIWFDWDKLEKILNNLIFNAIKFTNPGGLIVVRINKPKEIDEIKVNDKNLSVKYLEIEVEDNGVGINNEKLPYVFQRFYQVNQTRKGVKKGSGIGLAITKDLVELHHGKIEVNSEEGKGTKFTIKLPIGSEHLLPEEMIEIMVSETVTNFDIELEESIDELKLEQDLADNKLENTLLVVDDNPDIRLMIKEGFSHKYNVIEAENGKEGLNIALKEMPDLIVSDILMPEMDGIELCDALKTNIRTSHIPVILLTALNSVEHRIEGLESGADAYIPKPFKMKLLEVRAEKLIETRDLMRKRFQTEKELTPEKVTLNSLDEQFLKKIMDLMETNMSNDSYWVDDLVSDMNTSRSTFFRKLKKLTGQSPNDFIRMVRLKRAAQLLEQNELTIAQVSYMVGFADPGYFGKCFRKFFGDSPSNYIKKKTMS